MCGNRRAPASSITFLHFFCFALLSLSLFAIHGLAQTNVTAPATDPTEAQALDSIFRSWNISSSMSTLEWNTTGDPCSGNAVGIDKDDYDRFNPSIFCDCTSNNGSTCHIVKLTATNLKIVGTIPDELKHFTKLQNLQIAENYLTGPLPSFIGNFSNMKYLSIGKNALSGAIPKELGDLQELISLGMGMNNFSGSLPPELGNLTNLEEIYIDSIGISGEIPSTFAKLRKLHTIYAADNNFGGKVPDFLGNLTLLKSLRIQGNSFRGPIPSSLANLQNMTELRIGDLLGETSSLEFIGNMKLLTTLILRNAKISDTIPSNIGEFNLSHLDLSFNNITGTIPSSLFNIQSLEFLFLGNNSISGNIPSEKSGKLLNIDLSYNELTGVIPPWASEENLQLNLVANNFTSRDFNKILPDDLECLQRNYPCFRDRPRYSSFAINCGGGMTVSSDGITYEEDNDTLTTASYYVKDTRRWAVSSTGRFVESENPKYMENSTSNFTNTTDPKLFQSVRLSPSSLRYYGLGLENGPYNIELQFAEIAFPDDDSSTKTTARRVFDIYIQGILIVKDFDIKKEAGEAGGASFRAIKRAYNASVTNNFLEIHLFWAGKGTCCLPTQGYYGSLISAISVTPNFKPTVSNRPPSDNSGRNTTALVVGIIVGILALISICILGAWIWRRKRNKQEDEELNGLSVLPCIFSYRELKSATGNFSPENKLGEGGFGAVFKGILNDGTTVAVKQLSIGSLQGKREFVTEVATISAVKHRNLVNLHGCCFEGNRRLLVYEYLENGSLDRIIFGKSQLVLDWKTRFAICLELAKGICYLHEESSTRIVHRDIKSSNILLDDNLTVKISDFGLAKLFDDKLTHISTRVAGTIGYLAPEYAMRGHLTEKVDIFSFGVVLLEVLCGRTNTNMSLNAEKIYLVEWAWSLHERKRELEMLDPALSSYDKEEATRMILVAFLCTQTDPTLRPPMSRVVAMLIGDIEISDIPSKPTYLTDWQYDDLSGEATSTFDSSIGLSYN